MRGSSSSSRCTTQPREPLRATPETSSTGLPNSSSTCSRARRTTSTGDLATQPPEQLRLDRLVRRLVELAGLARPLRLRQPGADAARVVQLRLGLVEHLL